MKNMKYIIKLFSIILLILLYLMLSVIKFCTIKVLQYDEPVTTLYFAPNLCRENIFILHKGFILYNYRGDYSATNLKAQIILRKDEFYDPIYDFLVGYGWLILSICLLILLFIKIIQNKKKHLT